jgi:hypothetical protein
LGSSWRFVFDTGFWDGDPSMSYFARHDFAVCDVASVGCMMTLAYRLWFLESLHFPLSMG